MRLERLVPPIARMGVSARDRADCAPHHLVHRLALLYSLSRFRSSRQFTVFERLQLHLLPRGGRGGDGAAAVVHRRADHPARAATTVGQPGGARRHARSHAAKGTTPTMGGLIILFSALVATLLWARFSLQPSVRADRALRHAVDGRDRLARRLSQAQAEAARREERGARRAIQARRPGDRRRRARLVPLAASAVAEPARRVDDAAVLQVLRRHVLAGLRVALRRCSRRSSSPARATR